MTGNVLSAILEVFGQIGTWIIAQLAGLTEIFWAEGSLTFLGILAVCALGVSMIFLIIGIIQRFLHFRG